MSHLGLARGFVMALELPSCVATLFVVACTCGVWVAEQPWGAGELWANFVCAEAHAVPNGDQHLHLLVANGHLAVSVVPAVGVCSPHCQVEASEMRPSPKVTAGAATHGASVAPVSDCV